MTQAVAVAVGPVTAERVVMVRQQTTPARLHLAEEVEAVVQARVRRVVTPQLQLQAAQAEPEEEAMVVQETPTTQQTQPEAQEPQERPQPTSSSVAEEVEEVTTAIPAVRVEHQAEAQEEVKSPERVTDAVVKYV